MKNLTTFAIGFLVSGYVMADVLASGHYGQYPEQRFQQFQQPPQPQQAPSDITGMIANLFLEQGILGAMLIILGFYFYKMESQARSDRLKLQEKFEQLVEKSMEGTLDVKTHLASLDARVGNIEREMESTKEFLMTDFKRA